MFPKKNLILIYLLNILLVSTSLQCSQPAWKKTLFPSLAIAGIATTCVLGHKYKKQAAATSSKFENELRDLTMLDATLNNATLNPSSTVTYNYQFVRAIEVSSSRQPSTNLAVGLEAIDAIKTNLPRMAMPQKHKKNFGSNLSKLESHMKSHNCFENIEQYKRTKCQTTLDHIQDLKSEIALIREATKSDKLLHEQRTKRLFHYAIASGIVTTAGICIGLTYLTKR